MNQLTQLIPKNLHRQLGWQTFNDNVMGGKSTSAYSWQDQTLSFSGFVNTDGGGFASIRTAPEPELLANFLDISHPILAIELQGDGQRYQFGVQTQANLNYWIDIDSSPQWQTYRFPLTQLVAKRRGRLVADAMILKTEDITGFNLMISHGQHGSFELQVRNLTLQEALIH